MAALIGHYLYSINKKERIEGLHSINKKERLVEGSLPPPVLQKMEAWDHVCPACKLDKKESTIKRSSKQIERESQWFSIYPYTRGYECSRGHFIEEYIGTGTSCFNVIIPKSPKPKQFEPYWDKNGKYVHPEVPYKIIEWKARTDD